MEYQLAEIISTLELQPQAGFLDYILENNNSTLEPSAPHKYLLYCLANNSNFRKKRST